MSTFSSGAWAASSNDASSTPMALMKVARKPKRPTSHDCINIATLVPASAPVDSQCAWSCPMPKVPMMSGTATLTTVVVSTDDSMPSSTVTAASQR